MKYFFCFFFLLTTAGLFGQEVDSARVAREVDSLVTLCRNFTDNGKFEDALIVIKKAEELAINSLGDKSLLYAKCLITHGRVFGISEKMKEAEPYLSEANKLYGEILGKANPEYGISLMYLGNVYQANGKYEQSESNFKEAKSIFEATFGKNHPLYAAILLNLGNINLLKNDYDSALNYYNEAESLEVKLSGKKSSNYASLLNSIATISLNKGEYSKAESLFSEAVKIVEEVHGKGHPFNIDCLLNLGSLYTDTGDFDKAESFFNEILFIYQKEPTLSNYPNINVTINLANLYLAKGQFDKAEKLYIDAMNLEKSRDGAEKPIYALILNNLAKVYGKKGDLNKSKLLYFESKYLRETTLGVDHPEYAQSAYNLATVLLKEKEYAEAERLLIEAKSVWEKSLGKNNRFYAISLISLGSVKALVKEYKEAEEYYLESKDILRNVFGENYQLYAEVLNNLALLHWVQKDAPLATTYFLQDNAAVKNILEKATLYSSEYEMLKLNSSPEFRLSQESLYSFSLINHSLETVYAVFNNELFSKSALLDDAITRAIYFSKADSLTQSLNKEWKSTLFQINKWNEQPKKDSAIVARLEEKSQHLEKELIKRSAANMALDKTTTWQDVRSGLQPNEAALEFVRFRYYNPDPTDSILYAALVLRPEDEAPHFVYLCTEAQLNAVLARWDDNNVETAPAKVYWQKEGEPSLYELLWQPLEKLLPKGTIVWYAPAGLLHRLNLGAISRGKEPLTDDYFLRRIGSTRQVALKELSAPVGEEAVLFGGLRYESDTLAIQKSLQEQGLAARTRSIGERQPASPEDSTGSRGSILYLENSLTEVQNIAKSLKTAGFKAHTFTGFGGTEEAFLNAGGSYGKEEKRQSPRILHVATHGYFFPDPKEDTTHLRHLTSMERHIPYRASDNPFIRSGLLLSGSEQAWRTGKPASEKLADGILTAADIAAMDLSNTELAVLSACETGLGDVESNEGVYGLQRAFKIAGARYLVMSLWKVDDGVTMRLMTLFYNKWLNEKRSIPDAFRAAQQELRSTPEFSDPFFWAGFVLVE
jgi:CHAT domain-containing protein/lipopolysaccharide biosynthesis regulator YciM